mgnify:CR=1 FL=1
MPNQYPGEIINGIGSGITSAVKGVVSSISGGLQGAGESVQSTLDRPAHAIGVRANPLRIIDHPIKGVVRGTENAFNHGTLDTLEIVVGSIPAGLDEVPKTFLNLGEGKGLRMPEFPMRRR